MALPTSAEYPQTPLLQYDLNNIGIMPAILSISQVHPIVPQIAIKIANEASNKAHMHAGRMLFYNLCKEDSWYTRYFQEAMQTAADLITLGILNHRYRYPEQGIDDCVGQTISGMVSLLFHQYSDLKSMVDPKVLHAVDQNVQFFNNLKQELIQMQHSTPGYGPAPDFSNRPHTQFSTPQTYPYPQHAAHSMQMHPQYYPQQSNQGFPNGIHSGQSNQGYPQQGYPNNGYPQPMSNYPNRQDGSFAQPNGVRFAEPPAANIGERHSSYKSKGPAAVPATFINNDADDRFSSYISPREVQREEQLQPIVKVNVAASKSKVLLIDKGSEMERAQHQITYFGDSYIGNSIVRSDHFTEATKKLSHASIDELDENNANIYLDESIYVEPNQDSAIVCGLSKQFERQSVDSSTNVFRCFVAVVKPVQCVEDISEFVDSFREASSFTHLAVKIQSIAKALHIRKSEDATVESYCNNVISFLSHIDRLFTIIVNDFLKNNILLDIVIDSFCEDVSNLGDYIYKKKGNKYTDAYQAFEIAVINTMLEVVDEEICDDVSKRVVLADGLSTFMLPFNYSLTFVCMNDKELGYKLDTRAAIIDPDTAPNLYDIARTIPVHCKERDFPTTVNLLITADGAVYKIYRSYLQDGRFLIGKA